MKTRKRKPKMTVGVLKGETSKKNPVPQGGGILIQEQRAQCGIEAGNFHEKAHERRGASC